MDQTGLARRRFLRGAGAAALAAVSGGFVTACGDGNDAGGGPTTSATASGASASSKPPVRGSRPSRSSAAGGLLPAHAPSSVVTPDLPATDLVPAGFLAYPAHPAAETSGKPGHGGSATAMLMSAYGLPPAMGKNPFWQKLNAALGVSLDINYIPSAGWGDKVQTTIASGDLPEMMQLSIGTSHLNGVLAAKFQELSTYLSGDAVKQYPALAAIPAQTWSNMVIGGGLWGVPYPQPAIANILMARADILAEKGLTTDGLKDGGDFVKLCEELTDTRHNKFAIGIYGTALSCAQWMAGVPNRWRVVDGKFTSQYETDEYKQALDIVITLRKRGVMSPDAFSSSANVKEQFGGGSSALVKDNWLAWPIYLQTYPGIKVSGVALPKWEGGGQAPVPLGSRMYTFVGLRKTGDKSRIAELLHILNWLASPFGSEEYLIKTYGYPPRDYTLKGTNPVPTSTGTAEVKTMNLTYLAACPPVIYNSSDPQVTRDISAALAILSRATTAYPLSGLFSPAQLTKGATIDKNIGNVQDDIVQGRKDMTAWDAAVKAWRSGGGDQIRKEYEEAYAAAQ